MTENAADWQRVKEVFSAALQLAPDARESFVRRECGDDEEIFDEVTSLLALQDQAEIFLEKPAAKEISDDTAFSEKLEQIADPPDDGKLAELIAKFRMDGYTPPPSFDNSLAVATVDTVLQNRYRIIRPLGQGGMGEVYLAIDERLGHQVALKRMFHAWQEVLAQAFEREAKILARLHHPGLPKVSDHFAEGDSRYLVMQYIAGDDLGELLAKTGRPLPVRQVLDWAKGLLEVLEYLHNHEPPILHRDIKPQNLKLSDTGELFLLDFGLAKDTASSLSQSNAPSVIGYSLNYAPLEQINRERTTAETDIYAFCATLYHLLTGELPADSLSRVTAKADGAPDPLIPPGKLNLLIPSALSDVLVGGMALRREQRLNADQLRAGFENLNLDEYEDDTNKAGRSKTAKQKPALPTALISPTLELPPPVDSVQQAEIPNKSVPFLSPATLPVTETTHPVSDKTTESIFRPGQRILGIGAAAAVFLLLGIGLLTGYVQQFLGLSSDRALPSQSSPSSHNPEVLITPPTTPLAMNTNLAPQEIKTPETQITHQTPKPEPLAKTPTPKVNHSPRVIPTIIPQ